LTSLTFLVAKRGARTAAAALLVVVALSACGRVDTGAGEAARVGTDQLRTAAVLDQTSVVVALGQETGVPVADPADINRAQVSAWIEGELTAGVAKKLDVTVSEGDVDRFLARVSGQNGVTREVFEGQIAVQPGSWVTPERLEAFTRTFLEQQAIAEKLAPKGTAEQRNAALERAIGAEAAAQGVTVSPRFGSWDAAEVKISGSPDDLSSPPRLKEPEITSQPTLPQQG